MDDVHDPAPWTDRVITAAGHLVHLREAGPPPGGRRRDDAAPVVVLHDAGADSVDAAAWDDLAGERRVSQVLLPGVGRSAPLGRGAVLADVVALLAEVLDHVGEGPLTLVGTSIGGWFALEVALARPERVAHLVLLDAAGLHTPPGYLLGLFADGQGTAGHDGMLGPLLARRGQRDRTPTALAPALVDLTAAALCSWSPYVVDPATRRRAAGCRVPTTIGWGDRDALIPLSHGRALAAAIPGATLHVEPGSGHLLAVEAPSVVVALVLDGPPAPTISDACPSTSTA